MADTEEVRSWFDDDEPVLGTEAREAIRFQLQAAARGARTPRPRPAKWRGRIAFAAVALAAVAMVVVAAAAWWPGEPARIEPEPGADFERIADGHGEVVELRRGAATFDVDEVAPGARFAVRVGPDEVRVRGTRFRVVATGGRLGAVAVAEGVVEVFRDGAKVATIRRGERWRAPDAVAAAPDSASAAPSGSRIAPASALPAPSSALASSASASPMDSATASPSEALSASGSRPVAAMGPVGAASTGRERAGRSAQTRASGRTAEPPPLDAAFDRAWQAHVTGDAEGARRAFAELAARPDLGARRPDVLFWLAQSELRLGERSTARRRLTVLLEEHPTYLRASEARAQLRHLEESP